MSTRLSTRLPLKNSRSCCMEARLKEEYSGGHELSTRLPLKSSRSCCVEDARLKERVAQQWILQMTLKNSMWLAYYPYFSLIFYITALHSKTLGFILIGNDRTCDGLAVLVVLLSLVCRPCRPQDLARAHPPNPVYCNVPPLTRIIMQTL